MEWFCGFVDACLKKKNKKLKSKDSLFVGLKVINNLFFYFFLTGYFLIAEFSDFFFSFRFKFRLHVDDVDALHYIQSYLNIGKVTTSGSMSTFSVSAQQEMKIIL